MLKEMACVLSADRIKRLTYIASTSASRLLLPPPFAQKTLVTFEKASSMGLRFGLLCPSNNRLGLPLEHISKKAC